MRTNVFKSGCVGLAPSSGLLVHLCPVGFIESVFQLEQIWASFIALHVGMVMWVSSNLPGFTGLVIRIWEIFWAGYAGSCTV